MRIPTIERVNYSTRGEKVEIPDLIEVQKNSYDNFLQGRLDPDKRKNEGLHGIFKEVFPITSYDGNCTLEYVSYSLGVPKYNAIECHRRGLTYSVSLRVTFRLLQNELVREETVYMGTLPVMTDRGTFIINGAERVIVSQLHRSPGICFEKKLNTKGETIFSFRIIPYRGSWVEAELDTNDLVHVYIDRRRRRRKILATTLIKALGFSGNEELLDYYFDNEKVNIEDKKKDAEFIGRYLAKPATGSSEALIFANAGEKVTDSMLTRIRSAGVKSLHLLVDVDEKNSIVKMLEKDGNNSYDDALKDIYKKLRPGDPATSQNARGLIKRMFFDPKRYNLGKVGRHKINQKFYINKDDNGKTAKLDETTHVLKKEDMADAVKYLIGFRDGKGNIDDIDHLGNRRIRSIGELLENQCRIGLARMDKVIKERMNMFDVKEETITPHKLVNPKGLAGVVRDFFGRSQLSQFMDQTNPVAELTHKRRLSALGPGGLSRERAGFEVRDVHTSHYGRICPIETPEGPNIGLISSLSTYGKINEFGFITTPYLKVEKSKVTDEVHYLTADEEEGHIIAQANVHLDKNGKIKDEIVSARHQTDFKLVSPNEVEFVDVSPRQLVSVVAGLIPFLEHDDANRALMGSNMQRQAVPLLTPEAPLVGTGLELRAAFDSGAMVIAEQAGKVTFVDASVIEVKPRSRKYSEPMRYELKKFMRSNAGTCINQRPIVSIGDNVAKGAVLADGASTEAGELALGRNCLVAFMLWGGYNFEDAILISEKMVKEDMFTSIHIEEFEVGARDTKLGREEITRDIPNVGEEALKDLGEDGVIRVGAEVKPGDILVGKITPKSETELTPEERLLRAIFGEKAADVRDASLTVPAGTNGIVMDVKVFSRKERMGATDEEKAEDKEAIRKINAEFDERQENLTKDLREQLTEQLLGQKTGGDVIDGQTGEVIIPGTKKFTKSHIETLIKTGFTNLVMGDHEILSKMRNIFREHNMKLESFQMKQTREIEKIKRGDELDPGVIKQVKVYVASKRKLQVGDKMAGRHGNKGVIAKILPEEDMPFLPDGTPVEVVLNPLGVPSRMNVGQILETHLGWAAKLLGMHVATPVFDGIKESQIKKLLKKANLPEGGKSVLYDGRTGEQFHQKVTVGYIYILKLSHLVADKLHARAIGPYSLVTQQPLGGKAQRGGQRFGEMEVWALEAYGAAYALQELLTVKSDDVTGRTRIYESIVKGEDTLEAGTPESFNVLMKEMQSLCLDIRAEK